MSTKTGKTTTVNDMTPEEVLLADTQASDLHHGSDTFIFRIAAAVYELQDVLEEVEDWPREDVERVKAIHRWLRSTVTHGVHALVSARQAGM